MQSDPLSCPEPKPRSLYFAVGGLFLVTLVALAPLFFSSRPMRFIASYPPSLADLGKVAVVFSMGLTIGLGAMYERPRLRTLGRSLILVVLAGFMTLWHWRNVDSEQRHLPNPYAPEGYTVFSVRDHWQRPLYLAVLNQQTERQPGLSPVPHVFRPLPYGFTRSLELLTGDWVFACFTYRWFFTYWFLWASFRFAQVFQAGWRPWLTVAAVVILYPFSIRHYGGQLTDPLSHALFVLSMSYVVEDRFILLAASLALGVLAKETAVILVPAYWACYCRQGWIAVLKAGLLSLVCITAFAAARLPVGWQPGLGSINGARGLMIGTNLGIGVPLDKPDAPPEQNYLQPLLFIGAWLPWIFWHWPETDPRLRRLFMVLTPLLLASNLCFGWMYESRNYMPLIPLLAVMAQRGPLRRCP
jgi:hypothetical protein